MNLTARDLMATNLLTFRPDQPIHEAIDALLAKGVSGGPVLDGGRLVGILSEKDCLNLMVQGMAHQLPSGDTVASFMQPKVVTIGPDTALLTIGSLFLRNPFRRLPVVDPEGRVLGQVSRRDVLRGMGQAQRVTPSGSMFRRLWQRGASA
jgi:CBS domain-containing protein